MLALGKSGMEWEMWVGNEKARKGGNGWNGGLVKRVAGGEDGDGVRLWVRVRGEG